MRMWYFGCQGSMGHYLREKGYKCSQYDDPMFKLIERGGLGRYPDSGFAPRLPEGRPYQEEGVAMITWTALLNPDKTLAPYTVSAFWDRSIDRRYASNSCFIAEGQYCWSELLPMLQDGFPYIFKRFQFKITYLRGDTLQGHLESKSYEGMQ